MSKFIKVQDPDGDFILVNPRHIVAIGVEREGPMIVAHGSSIMLANGMKFVIKDLFSSVEKQIVDADG